MIIIKVLIIKLLFVTVFVSFLQSSYAQLSTVWQGGRVVTSRIINDTFINNKSNGIGSVSTSLPVETNTEVRREQTCYQPKVCFPLRSIKSTSSYGSRMHPVFKK